MSIALFLFLVAFCLRLIAVVVWHFDGLYGQDAFAYFQQAIAIAERLPQGQLPPTDFFWPNGFPFVAALVMLVLGKTALAAQLVSLLCGALLSILAYVLSRELFPTVHYRAGILAGLIVATAGQPILSSMTIMADMLALFWATLAAWLLVRAWRATGQAWWLLSAGTALALATITRWSYGLLVPAFAGYVLYQLRHHRNTWWIIILPTLSGASIVLFQVWLSVNRPEGLLHPWLLHWHPAHAFQRHFENIDGHFRYWWPVGLFYMLPVAHPAYLFPLLSIAALWGIWRLWQARRWEPLILLLGWSGIVYLFLAGIPYENFRFGLTLYIPVVVLAGFGLSEWWDSARTRRIAQITTAVSLAGMLVWTYPMLNQFLTTANHSKHIANQVEQTLPQQATLLTFGLTLTIQHYTHLHTRELFYLDDASLDDLMRSCSPIYLLLDVRNAESQWRGKPPEVNYRWLREHTSLTRINEFPPYTLFRVYRNSSSGGERGGR